MVCASTGKALRPYSPDIYTASKRAAEWVASGVAAAADMLISAGRFTHVLDNSVIYRRLLGWASRGRRDPAAQPQHRVLRAVSARVGAAAAAGLPRRRSAASSGSSPSPISAGRSASWTSRWACWHRPGSATPIYFSGYDPGYEEIPFPGLYDPMTAGDVSPLLNAFEAGAVTASPCPMVDAFRLDMAPNRGRSSCCPPLDEICDRTHDPAMVRAGLNELSWSLLDCTLQAAPRRALTRSAAMAHPHSASLGADHRRILEAIEDHAARLTRRGLTAWPAPGGPRLY